MLVSQACARVRHECASSISYRRELVMADLLIHITFARPPTIFSPAFFATAAGAAFTGLIYTPCIAARNTLFIRPRLVSLTLHIIFTRYHTQDIRLLIMTACLYDAAITRRHCQEAMPFFLDFRASIFSFIFRPPPQDDFFQSSRYEDDCHERSIDFYFTHIIMRYCYYYGRSLRRSQYLISDELCQVLRHLLFLADAS